MEFTESLRKNYQFRHVYSKGKSLANRHLVVCILKNGNVKNRLGIQVSKRVGKSVIRSRVTRLIRECYRLNEKNFSVGLDIVVIARAPANGASFIEISNSLINLFKRLKIISGM